MSYRTRRRWVTFDRMLGYWWLNVGSWCLYGKNLNHFPRLFSERFGKRRTLQIGRWLFGFDRRWREP